jgi:hypothetical protein
MSNTLRVSFDEWIAEIEKLERRSEIKDAFTCSEICLALRRSPKWIQGKLRLGIQEGRIEVVRKRLRDISGRNVMVPAYRLVKSKGKKNGK